MGSYKSNLHKWNQNNMQEVLICLVTYYWFQLILAAQTVNIFGWAGISLKIIQSQDSVDIVRQRIILAENIVRSCLIKPKDEKLWARIMVFLWHFVQNDRLFYCVISIFGFLENYSKPMADLLNNFGSTVYVKLVKHASSWCAYDTKYKNWQSKSSTETTLSNGKVLHIDNINCELLPMYSWVVRASFRTSYSRVESLYMAIEKVGSSDVAVLPCGEVKTGASVTKVRF